MPQFEVIVLFNGYSNIENGKTIANCTCTLIKGCPNIIVDTMTAWDGHKLIDALKQYQLTPNDIDYVINTHGHSDHIGCNYLFERALHIVGYCISHQHEYYEHDFKNGHDYIINDKIRVCPTPGHTLQDVSVLVENDCREIIAITGDLFENQNDLNDARIWIEAGSDNEQLQAVNRRRILEIATFIIPGHGSMFKVSK